MARALIFVDAGAFVARHRNSDEFHEIAVKAWNDLEARQTPCVTSNLVLSEAAEFLRRNWGSITAAGRLRIWLSSEYLTVLRPDRGVELEAADLLEKYADQRVGFVDCVSWVLMRRGGVDKVFGFDRHFRLAGFNLWPPERPS